jgi:hypothetical protein
MRKITLLLTRKHVNPSRISLLLLGLAGLLFAGNPAQAQSANPFRFAAQAAQPSGMQKEAAEVTTSDGEENPLSISVTPSATTGKFLISLKGNREDRVRIKVTDRHGCVVDNHEVSGYSSLQLGFWYHPGVYQLHISQGGNSKTFKLEKLKD